MAFDVAGVSWPLVKRIAVLPISPVKDNPENDATPLAFVSAVVDPPSRNPVTVGEATTGMPDAGVALPN
jgi:hypothetical protein